MSGQSTGSKLGVILARIQELKERRGRAVEVLVICAPDVLRDGVDELGISFVFSRSCGAKAKLHGIEFKLCEGLPPGACYIALPVSEAGR